jgi:hypothetical protein
MLMSRAPRRSPATAWHLPASFLPVLQAWWRKHGSPVVGPAFPVRKGPRAGQRKQGKSSYAWHLREALWLAGIVRPLPGFEEARESWQLAQAELERAAGKSAERATLDALVAAAAAAEAEARKRCLIQAGSEDFKPLHFHSFRRAFATGLASSGMNVQQAMALAGHRNASTHMRYVRITEVLDIPEAALPKLSGAATVPFALLAASQSSVFFWRTRAEEFRTSLVAAA